MIKTLCLYAFFGLILYSTICHAQKIDRKVLVNRHNVIVTRPDTLSSLTVGNGKFAFTVDATGLQSFPEYYKNGIPLGTQSEWGWHSFPNTAGYKFSETLTAYDFNNIHGLYAVQANTSAKERAAINYFRENPHRLQLGNIGLGMTKKDGSEVKPEDLQDVHQELNLWTGEITSNFKIEGVAVSVTTCAGANSDVIAFKVVSDLVKSRHVWVKLRFPAPTNEFTDVGVNYKNSSSNQTIAGESTDHGCLFTRKLDNTTYYVSSRWDNRAVMSLLKDNDYELISENNTNSITMSMAFSKDKPVNPALSFTPIEQSSIAGWQKFWLSGGAVDLLGSTDARAFELERRIVLSQYLMRVQEAGSFPSQETGLTYNSWYGRPHMEMYWWHAAHYALWGRTELLEKSMQWYFTAYKGAQEIAERQGFKGVRWQKMTDNAGGEGPSSIGSFLIWQQPHVIYLSELIYRNKPSKAILQKYKKLIFATADFMASFAHYDKETGRYNLGKGIIPAQESFDPNQTFNSPYELAYWKWALQTAQNWRKRLGIDPNKQWQDVIDKLAPLAQKDGLYLPAQNVDDAYSPNSKYTKDHPAVLAALSTLPPNGYVDTAIMHRTYNMVQKTWHWDSTWGWDFPMMAMTATRLGQPEEAIDALLKNAAKNTYLANGHNYQDKRLTLYLPGNGGLLSAITLMCAGYDGNKIKNPGFPKNGKWKVKWEGLKPMP